MRVSLLTQDKNATKIAFELREDRHQPEFVLVDWSDELDPEMIFRKQLIADHLVMMSQDHSDITHKEIDEIVNFAMTCSIRVI